MSRCVEGLTTADLQGNLSADTQRLLRRILPSNALWQSFRDGTDFYSADQTIRELSNYFETVDDNGSNAKLLLPPSVESMLESTIAMEALGGMLFYLKTLNLDKDLVSQKNFNIYDPIKEGKSLVLDGVTLGHMEVLVNNEGGTEGTLLELLQNCVTPSGKNLRESRRFMLMVTRQKAFQDMAWSTSPRGFSDKRSVRGVEWSCINEQSRRGG